MKILVCNAGSTSLKFKLYDMPSEKLLCDAKIERVGSLTDAYYTYKNYLSGDSFRKDNLSVPDYKTGILAFIDTMTDAGIGVIQNISEVECVGFKTVISKGHNGVCELTEEVLQGMKDYMFISEGHTKAYLGAIAQFNEIHNVEVSAGNENIRTFYLFDNIGNKTECKIKLVQDTTPPKFSEWKIENEKWRMENAKCTMHNAKWRIKSF